MGTTPISKPTRRVEPRVVRYFDRFESTFEAIVNRVAGPLVLTAITLGVCAILFSVLRVPDVGGVAGTALMRGRHAVERIQSAVASRGQPAVISCPGVATVQARIGVDAEQFGYNQGEVCGFHWDGSDALVNCPGGFICTFDIGTKIIVMPGDDQWVQVVHAATWRYVGSYPTHDLVRQRCELLRVEQQLAQLYTPGVPVEAVGFGCN